MEHFQTDNSRRNSEKCQTGAFEAFPVEANWSSLTTVFNVKAFNTTAFNAKLLNAKFFNVKHFDVKLFEAHWSSLKHFEAL